MKRAALKRRGGDDPGRRCEWCGCLHCRIKRGRTPYCSRECGEKAKRAAKRTGREIVCAVCGARVCPIVGRLTVNCSPECSRRHQRELQRAAVKRRSQSGRDAVLSLDLLTTRNALSARLADDRPDAAE